MADRMVPGWARVNGHEYPLRGLWLADQRIHFGFDVPPRPRRDVSGRVTFLAPDGSVVVISSAVYHFEAGCSYAVQYELTVWPGVERLRINE